MGKLVRDKIPDIIRADGSEPMTRQLADDEFLLALGYKAVEEAQEFAEAESDDKRMGELADQLTVIRASVAVMGHTMEELEALEKAKTEERGGFESRIYWEGNEESVR